MARTNYTAEDFDGLAEESLESVREALDALDKRLDSLRDTLVDDAAGVRMDIGQTRRELVHLRSSLQRLQARFDNQLTVLVLSNVASGVGVAALVLAATQGFN